MSTKNKLLNLINKIQDSREESKKAASYADGYLDCLKDMMLENQGEIGKVLKIKNDGEIRLEIYAEMLPILEEAAILFNENNDPSSKSDSSDLDDTHPSDRAKGFLKRIGRI